MPNPALKECLSYDISEVHMAHDSDVPPQDNETTMITQVILGPME